MADSRLADHQFKQALFALEQTPASREDKIQMLMEMAMGLQQRPESVNQLHDAVTLYERANDLCELPAEALISARITARKATALHMIPADEPGYLVQAQNCLESAIVVLREHGSVEETAEAQMNLGLVLQALAGFHRARIADAIAAYQHALRVFNKQNYPSEFAILHNNLAAAFLSIPASDERGKMREALAVQSFEAALEVVTLIDQPSEYAMLQNNLGNALQYVSSSHAVENNLRALAAYDEALKVRSAIATPMAYANTISNKANCLRNLPDDPAQPEAGNHGRLREAHHLLQEAQGLFFAHGEAAKARMLEESLVDVQQELSSDRNEMFGKGLI